MLFTVVSISDVETKKGKTGTYETFSVTYKDAQNKLGAKTLVDFNNKEVFDEAKKLKPSDVIEVVSEKVNGFWQWTSLEKVVGKVNQPTSGTPYKKDDLTQKYIVRQNALTNAVKFHEFQVVHGNAEASVEVVLNIAADFEAWVFRTHDTAMDAVENMKDDDEGIK